MFKKKNDLPSPKPDPPRHFCGNLLAQFLVSMLTLSFCVLTVNMMNLTFKHEETAKRYDSSEIVIVIPDGQL